MSGVDLQLITDMDIYISMIATRHAKANNPSLPSYNSKFPRQDLIYLDANNLYGHAISQYLLTGGFRIMSSEEVEGLDIDALCDESDNGYIYEVDLHYPVELHDLHDDYPLEAESLTINSSMYSPTQQSVFPKSAPHKKLTPNLLDKKRYVVHYKNLKLYVKLGLVVRKIHRVWTFKQSPWLKSYIDFNTRQRPLSDSGFLRDFFCL